MTKSIAILGSTGSIGRNALRVIDALGPEYRVIALTAQSNVELLSGQIKRYKPQIAAITDSGCFEQLRAMTIDTDVELLAGTDSLVEIAQLDNIDIVLTAVVGAAGLPSVLAAAK